MTANQSITYIIIGVGMFTHIMVGANDVEAAKVFYDAILGELGHKPGVMDSKGRCFYRTKTGVFASGE